METIDKLTVSRWTPEVDPNPSASLIEALYLEYVNDYLTYSVWGEAHHMDADSAKRFLDAAKALFQRRCDAQMILRTNVNPHA